MPLGGLRPHQELLDRLVRLPVRSAGAFQALPPAPRLTRVRGPGAWTLLPVVCLRAAVLQGGGELLPKAVEIVEVQGGERVSVAIGALGEHCTPRVDDDGPSVGPSSVGLPSPL